MTKRPGYEEAERIHSSVMELLREEEDSKGDLKNTGEARALERMRRGLEREIAKDATEFLNHYGFNASGEKVKPKAKRRARR